MPAGDGEYGWFNCIIDPEDTSHGKSTETAAYLSNSGKMMIFSVALQWFYINEINSYEKVFNSLMSLTSKMEIIE